MSLLFSRATDDDYVAHLTLLTFIYNVTSLTVQVILSVPLLYHTYLGFMNVCRLDGDYLDFLHDFLSSAK